jgi:DeoR/GlpR family transcriptional regulator of sugar metabolism
MLELTDIVYLDQAVCILIRKIKGSRASMSDMQFLEERRKVILEHIQQYGRVSVNTLSEEMGVSTVTIRQDLRALEQLGLLKRTHGGAIRRLAEQTIAELSFHIRQEQNALEKDAIARAAAALVENGYSIALDASTTAYAMVPYLKTLSALTVVTNSLAIAQSFLDSPHIEVLLPGGRLRRDSISLVGQPELLPDISLNIGFVGAVGITEHGGVGDIDPDEVAIKRAMIGRCMKTIIIADSSKWNRLAPYIVLPTNAIRHIITTNQAPTELVNVFLNKQINVDVVMS